MCHIHINFSVIKTLMWQTWRMACISTSDGLIPWSRVILEKLVVIKLVKNFPDFVGTEVLLLYSQEPTKCFYTEANESSPCPPILFLLRSIYTCTFQAVSLLHVSSPKTCMPSLFPHKCLMPYSSHILFYMTVWWKIQHIVISKQHYTSTGLTEEINVKCT
jgi:hypothetical protein